MKQFVGLDRYARGCILLRCSGVVSRFAIRNIRYSNFVPNCSRGALVNVSESDTIVLYNQIYKFVYLINYTNLASIIRYNSLQQRCCCLEFHFPHDYNSKRSDSSKILAPWSGSSFAHRLIYSEYNSDDLDQKKN